MNIFCFFCLAESNKRTLAFTAWSNTPCCAAHAKAQWQAQKDWQLRQEAAQKAIEETRERMAGAVEEMKDKV